MKSVLEAMPGELIAERSRTIAENIARLEQFRDAGVIMLYLSIPGEVNTAPLAHICWSQSKTVVAPRACGDTKRMKPAVCPPGDEDLIHPNHGLRQPSGTDEVDIGDIDLVIVPALAFDEQCNRLGRGGGFYDRFLCIEQLRAVTMGVCFTEQIVPKLPIDPNDRPVDLVVTDQQIYARNA
jgi:5-formyltetrahydrofolate cyclo-ligase